MAFAWTATTLPAARTWSAVCHNGSVYCALVFNSSVVATSPDGETWTEHAMPVSALWQAIAWNGTVFCALAFDSGTIAATSPDGETWTAHTMPATAKWSAIVWNGSVFCAISDGASGSDVCATSPDGITWTTGTLSAVANWSGLAWNGSVFVATAGGGSANTTAATSSDGLAWVAQTMPVSAEWWMVAWNGSVFCAIAFSTDDAATSPDGVTWTAQTLPTSGGGWQYLTVSPTSGLFLAVPWVTGTLSASSPDGATWTSQTLPASDDWYAVGSDGTDFVALSTSTAGAIAVEAALPPGYANLHDTIGGTAVNIGQIGPTLADAIASATSNNAQVWPTLTDSLQADALFTADSLANLIERITAAASAGYLSTLMGSANDSVTFADSVSAAWTLLLEEGIAAAGEAVGTVHKLAALVDALAATGQATNRLTALAACVQAMAMEGLIRQGFNAECADSAPLVDACASLARLLGPLVDGVLATDDSTPMLRLSLIASDTVSESDAAAALLRANMDLADGMLLYATVRIGGTEYSGWCLNTDLKAGTQYTNTPFDSFASFKGKHYGAGPNGIVEFTGDTDDGTPIAWSLKTFLLDWGTTLAKRLPDIFIGATTDGQLVAKVITRAAGVVSEDHYYVERLPTDEPGVGRVQVGRGLRSTFWQVELTSVQGASLALDGIEFKPVVLDRRT